MLLPAYEGVMMSMECASGYEWDVSPYTGSRVANCTNNTGTGQWSIADSATCVRMFEYWMMQSRAISVFGTAHIETNQKHLKSSKRVPYMNASQINKFCGCSELRERHRHWSVQLLGDRSVARRRQNDNRLWSRIRMELDSVCGLLANGHVHRHFWLCFVGNWRRTRPMPPYG